jgi:hypothetical protein
MVASPIIVIRHFQFAMTGFVAPAVPPLKRLVSAAIINKYKIQPHRYPNGYSEHEADQ